LDTYSEFHRTPGIGVRGMGMSPYPVVKPFKVLTREIFEGGFIKFNLKVSIIEQR
jgi:hypothetical protein